MRTNAAVDINTDWQINGIVKPNHVNALTRSIKYDYVVTEQMLEGKTGTVNVDELLGGNKIDNITGVVHVLINTIVPDTVTLYFPASGVGGPSGTLDIHVHTIGPFKAAFRQAGPPYIAHYLHTHGAAEAVTLTNLSKMLYVGAFTLESPLQVEAGGSFVYESALGDVPTTSQTSGGSVTRKAWMSNAIGDGSGGGSSNVLKLCAYGIPYNTFDVNPSHTDPEDIDGRALDLEGYDAVEWSTNLACEDHIEAEHGIQLDAPFESYSGSIISDNKPTVYVNPENCKGTGASFTIKSHGLPIEDGAAIEFNLDGDFAATGLSGGFSVRFYGTIKYNGVTISGADAGTTISGGVAGGGDISGTFSGAISSGGIVGNALSFGFTPNFSGKISGDITSAAPSTGASLSGTGTIQILDEANQPVITLNVASGAITSGEINEAGVAQRDSVSGGTDSSNLPRITKFIPARYLTIDPDTMVEGKVYPIHVKCWNRGDIMSCRLLLYGVFYPVYVHCPNAGVPTTVGAFSKFGYDSDGFYMIDSSNHKFSIKAFDGSVPTWTEASFEMNMTTTSASGFEPLRASGAHNDGHDHSVEFTVYYPDTPGASFSLFEIRILNGSVYLLNNTRAGQVRPKMVTVAPPGGAAWGQCESPAPYAGTVYLMKKNGKVYALGY